MKNKTTAGILAIFLGGLGVHRFYLGQIGLGILYLVFCWTFIPAVIALIDGIIFLTQDEQKFADKYNKGRIKLNPGQKVNSIKDLFSINLEHFDPKDYNFIGQETNKSGHVVKKYRELLPKKECRLFDVLNINDIQGSRNYTFENGKYGKSDIYAIESLLSSVYYLLGKDTLSKGMLEKDEKESFLNGDPYISRLWSEEHLSQHVMMSFAKDGYEMTVFGLGTQINNEPSAISDEVSPYRATHFYPTLAGFQHHNAERLIEELKPGTELQLRRDPQNQIDSNAIEIYYKDQKLGYLPKEYATSFAKQMDKGDAFDLKVFSYDPEKSDFFKLTMELIDLDYFSKAKRIVKAHEIPD